MSQVTTSCYGKTSMANSLNGINPHPKNVRKIFMEALNSVKEDIFNKKLKDIPAHLHDSATPIEAIPFERKLLQEIVNRMDITLS